jgi:hypothetical protein
MRSRNRLGGWPPSTTLVYTIPTEGAPSFAFFARVGGDAACYLILLWIRDQNHLASARVVVSLHDNPPLPIDAIGHFLFDRVDMLLIRAIVGPERGRCEREGEQADEDFFHLAAPP